MDDANAFTDARDLARAKRGDLAAFNALVERHQHTLFAVSLRMLGDSQAAADVTQDSIFAAWQRLRDFKSGNFRSWLVRIAVNRCYDQLRSRQRHHDASFDELLEVNPGTELLAGQATDPADLLLDSDLAKALLDGLHVLPVDQRAVVILCDVQGFSYNEAAEVEGTQVGTIKSRLSRGRARLRDWLAERPELLPATARSTFARSSERTG